MDEPAGLRLPRAPALNNTCRIAVIGLVLTIPVFAAGPPQTGRASSARTSNDERTIAHVLHTKLPWHVDGTSLVGARRPTDATVTQTLCM